MKKKSKGVIVLSCVSDTLIVKRRLRKEQWIFIWKKLSFWNYFCQFFYVYIIRIFCLHLVIIYVPQTISFRFGNLCNNVVFRSIKHKIIWWNNKSSKEKGQPCSDFNADGGKSEEVSTLRPLHAPVAYKRINTLCLS